MDFKGKIYIATEILYLSGNYERGGMTLSLRFSAQGKRIKEERNLEEEKACCS
jgi:hypothetical protein